MSGVYLAREPSKHFFAARLSPFSPGNLRLVFEFSFDPCLRFEFAEDRAFGRGPNGFCRRLANC